MRKLLLDENLLSESSRDEIKDEIIDIFDDAIRIADRRLWLCKNAPVCSKCGSKQIQLVQWTCDDKSASWKCRKCRHKFDYEPLNDVSHEQT